MLKIVKNFQRKKVWCNIYVLLLIATAGLLYYILAENLTLTLHTNAYGNVCQNCLSEYTANNNTTIKEGQISYNGKYYRFTLPSVFSSSYTDDLKFYLDIYEYSLIQDLPTVIIDKVVVRVGVFPVFTLHDQKLSTFLYSIHGLEDVSYDSKEYKIIDHRAVLAIKKELFSVLKLSIQGICKLLLVLFVFVALRLAIQYIYTIKYLFISLLCIFYFDFTSRVLPISNQDQLFFYLLGIILSIILCIFLSVQKKSCFHQIIFLSLFLLGMRVFQKIGNWYLFAGSLLMVIGSIGIVKQLKKRNRILINSVPSKRFKGKNLLILLFLAIGYGIILLYALTTNPCYGHDEKYVIETAQGFINTGKLVQWDFVKHQAGAEYPRAALYTIIVALAFKLFGVSIFTARCVSVFWGVIFIILLYLFLWKIFSDSRLCVIVCSLIALNTNIMTIFRTARMYCMILPCTLLLYFFSYMALNTGNKFKFKNKVTNFLCEYFDFHFGYAFLFLIMLFTSITLVQQSVVLVIGIYLYIIYRAFTTKEKKYRLLCIIGLICLLIFTTLTVLYASGAELKLPYLVLQLLHQTSMYFSWQPNPRITYIYGDLSAFGSISIGISILILCSVVILFLKRHGSKQVDFIKYIWLIQFSTYSYFVFFSDKTAEYRYMCFVQPLIYIIVAYIILNVSVYPYKYLLLIYLLAINLNTFEINVNQVLSGKSYSDAIRPSNFIAGYNAMYKDAENKSSITLFPSWYQSFYLQQFDEIQLIDEYMYDERSYQNITQSGGYNFDLLLSRIQESTNGYISFETGKLYLWPYTYDASQSMFERIAGTGKDIYNLEIFKFNILYPQEHEIAFLEPSIENDYIKVYIAKNTDGTMQICTYLKENTLPQDIELFGIRLNICGNTYTYQLKINDVSRPAYYLLSSKNILPLDSDCQLECLSMYQGGKATVYWQ